MDGPLASAAYTPHSQLLWPLVSWAWSKFMVLANSDEWAELTPLTGVRATFARRGMYEMWLLLPHLI